MLNLVLLALSLFPVTLATLAHTAAVITDRTGAL